MPTPPHILELRKMIGHHLLLVPTVTAAIFDDDDRLLVARIARPGDERWMFPGGMLEPDERPIEAVVREAREETGLDVVPTSIVGTYGGPEFRHVHPNGDETAFVMTTWLCDIVGGTLQTDGDEVADLRWVTRDEALALLSGAWFPIVVDAVFSARRRD